MRLSEDEAPVSFCKALKVKLRTKQGREDQWTMPGTMTGSVKLTEGIHPEVVGIAGTFGGWSQGRPVAQEAGIHFNTLLPIDMKHVDPISGGLDSCVQVKVTRLGP